MELEGNLLKRSHPETHSPPEPVSNKRCRNLMVNLPFNDDDSVFREFLHEQHLPLYPDIIYLSDEEDEAPEEPEEEDWWMIHPRFDLPLIVDQDSTPSSRLNSLNVGAGSGGKVFDGSNSVSREFPDQPSLFMYSDFADISEEDMTEYQDVERWMSRLDRLFVKGQDSAPSSRRISFSETSPLLVDADCRCGRPGADRLMRPAMFRTDHCTPGQYLLIEQSRRYKPVLGLASAMGKSWMDLLALFEEFDNREVLGQNIASKTKAKSHANVFHGLAVGSREAPAELPQFNFPNNGGPRSGDLYKNCKFDVIQDFPVGCGPQASSRPAVTDPPGFEVVEDNFS
ncbi:hypothetical protein CDL15_Pgr028102 [Punica granatum]|uniref:Uncharacterized protein n=1 Tax=Punica granatum TaxID=22663 RepID=A0A218XJD4_PUNGR|nr:hypothetical protein CDL15_Pgr028102 [Punica granatum]